MKWNVKKRRKLESVFFVFLLIAFAIFLVYSYYLSQKLEDRHLISVGKVESLFTAKGIYGFSVRYTYSINGKIYNGSSLIDISKSNYVNSKLNNLLLGKSLPIVYSPTNADNSLMLLERKDYSRFKVPLPDSLVETVTNLENIIRNN